MSEVVGERRFIPPNERLKSDFIDLVTDCRRREPLSPKIKVWIDEYNSCVAEIEEESKNAQTGQKNILYRTYAIDPEGKVTEDSEPLGARLARDIRANTVNPQPSQLQQEVEELRRDFGCSEIEALLIIFNALMVTESGMKAADELIKTVEAQAKEDELSFNDVDAFELAEVIDEVRDNFPLI
jgi:hypothetical protein